MMGGVGWEEPGGGVRYEVSTRGRPASVTGGQPVGGPMNSLVTLEQGREEAWGQVEDSGPEPLGVGATGCQQGVSPRLHVGGDHTSVTVTLCGVCPRDCVCLPM